MRSATPTASITKIDPGGPNEFEFAGWGNPSVGPIFSPRAEFIGPTVFVGNGCVANDIPLATNPPKIAVIERGGPVRRSGPRSRTPRPGAMTGSSSSTTTPRPTPAKR